MTKEQEYIIAVTKYGRRNCEKIIKSILYNIRKMHKLINKIERSLMNE
ncbi:hypothetical protein LCGC14_0794380 [marine sediment metagenome]|uniref:Uncharacterized protein n=1 Tax=marine sediment metagenome TaxID=412755 RepID=A0A0F9SBM1_9ZZZZ